MTTPLIVEPWQPQEGDWVRINPSPECPSWHSQLNEPYPAYGRVESVDPTYDDPEIWVRVLGEDHDDPTPEPEARHIAAVHAGHRYHVTDTFGLHQQVTWIDGMYAAMEMEPVSQGEALAHIFRARMELKRLGPDYKLRRALFGAAGVSR